jgi:hypothetical protein
MDDITSLEGPVETIDGKLVLQIPLAYGGAALLACSRGIGQVRGADLVVTIPDWLAKMLSIKDGSEAVVDNRDGKFNIKLASRPQRSSE